MSLIACTFWRFSLARGAGFYSCRHRVGEVYRPRRARSPPSSLLTSGTSHLVSLLFGGFGLLVAYY